MKIAFSSGYGCGNLGDDAIFLGLREEYPNVIEVGIVKPVSRNGILYTDLPEELDYSIIGGGYVFNSQDALDTIVKVSKKSKRYSIEGVGIEPSEDKINGEWKSEIKELCNGAEKITVRSQKCVEILEGIDVDSTYRKDFAYNLKQYVSKGKRNKEVGITFNMNSIRNESERAYNTVLPYVEKGYKIRPLVHCRHYFGLDNNLVAVQWLIYRLKEKRESVILNHLPSNHWNTPKDILYLIDQYTIVEKVFSDRYHPFVFGDMTDTPVQLQKGHEDSRIRHFK